MRGETSRLIAIFRRLCDFNPLPSCEGRRLRLIFQPLYRDISIHSPHARGDRRNPDICALKSDFNPLPSCEGRQSMDNLVLVLIWISIHSPHARGDTAMRFPPQSSKAFQSTPLMRGETGCVKTLSCLVIFQSTPLMRGETRFGRGYEVRVRISIHSPHARGDFNAYSPPECCRLFQSTPLMRGETTDEQGNSFERVISIHSPHARGDSINFQRIHRIQGSLYNTIHFTRFREFFQSVLGRKNAVYAVRSSPENHDSFTFAQPFLEYTVTP